MRLVDDDRVVAAQHAIALDLGEQHAVRHELDVRGLLDLVVEPDLVANDLAELGVQLVGHAGRHAGRRDAPRLCTRDLPVRRPPHREADLRKLRGLSRARLARDDDHLVLVDRVRDIDDTRRDRQVLGERYPVAQLEAGAQHVGSVSNT